MKFIKAAIYFYFDVKFAYKKRLYRFSANYDNYLSEHWKELIS